MAAHGYAEPRGHVGRREVPAQVDRLDVGVAKAGAANLGVAYYAQWKLTQDTLTGLPALIVNGKNSSAALAARGNSQILRQNM